MERKNELENILGAVFTETNITTKSIDKLEKQLLQWRNKWGVELLEGLLSKRLRYPTDDHYKEWKSETDGYVSAFEHGASTVRVEITKLKQQIKEDK